MPQDQYRISQGRNPGQTEQVEKKNQDDINKKTKSNKVEGIKDYNWKWRRDPQKQKAKDNPTSQY